MNILPERPINESRLPKQYEAEHEGRKITLNKPVRSKNGPKKFHVYVKDPKSGNIKKVNFGDPDMEIKRDDPERRKQFWTRFSCADSKDVTTPKFWSCHWGWGAEKLDT